MVVSVLVWVLVGFASLMTAVCALAVWVMRDPLQKLHFLSPPATLGIYAVVIALFLGESNHQAGVKGLLVALVLLFINSVVTHATARAYRIRELGRFFVRPEDPIRRLGSAKVTR